MTQFTDFGLAAPLLKALHAYRKNLIHPQPLAEQACHIELEILKEPIGKQDQYIAAYGGLTAFEFHKDDKVTARPLKVSEETLFNLEDNLLLFFTGYSRSASKILAEQDARSRQKDNAMIANLHQVKEIGYRSKTALEQGDLEEFAREGVRAAVMPGLGEPGEIHARGAVERGRQDGIGSRGIATGRV